MANIEVYHDEDLEKALKRFKRKVEKEGIIREWKKRQYFKKPSIVRHEQKIERATQNYLMILRQLETARGTDNEGRIQTLVTKSFNRLNTLLASDPANNDMMMMIP